MKKRFRNDLLPQSITIKSYAEFFVALGKAAFHGFVSKQYDEAIFAIMDAGTVLGMEETDDRLIWRLIDRSVMQAIIDLTKDNQDSIPRSEENDLSDKIKELRYDGKLTVDNAFLLDQRNVSLLETSKLF
ncbi:MAG: hypothetical protein FWG88_11865 [Oscillospiraceae bacterium]|nr:hypothetical protein [Oscillospiraceae bacterium]